jgi:hypothetical protein
LYVATSTWLIMCFWCLRRFHWSIGQRVGVGKVNKLEVRWSTIIRPTYWLWGHKIS